MELLERVVTLEQTTKAAHHRLDRHETVVRDDLREIKDQIDLLSEDIKEVIAWMNRGKGWAAAALLLAGIAGGAAAKLIGIAFAQ